MKAVLLSAMLAIVVLTQPSREIDVSTPPTKAVVSLAMSPDGPKTSADAQAVPHDEAGTSNFRNDDGVQKAQSFRRLGGSNFPARGRWQPRP
jgi:hypothetical protein